MASTAKTASPPPSPRRVARGARNHARGRAAERLACAALRQDGWTVLGERVRTEAGEIDIVAERDGLLGLIEVKARPTLAQAAACLTRRQQARLCLAGEILLGNNPHLGAGGVRFDLLLVDDAGTVRRIADAFRAETSWPDAA